jgi:hypothetical protein
MLRFNPTQLYELFLALIEHYIVDSLMQIFAKLLTFSLRSKLKFLSAKINPKIDNLFHHKKAPRHSS